MLDIRQLSYRVGQKEILRNINTSFGEGLFHIVLGPNGSGKSTLLKAFSGNLKIAEGHVFYNQKDIRQIGAVPLARLRAVMSQESELHFPLSVYDIVKMGRYPYFDLRPSRQDEEIIGMVMEKLDITDFSERDYNTLSGGEKQRVQFARVLAQLGKPGDASGKYLFLDEAVSNLDLKHQQHVLNLAREYCKQYGVTVIAILHDINLSLRYGDRFYFLHSGQLKFELQSKDQLNEMIIREIFEVESKLMRDEDGELMLRI